MVCIAASDNEYGCSLCWSAAISGVAPAYKHPRRAGKCSRLKAARLDKEFSQASSSRDWQRRLIAIAIAAWWGTLIGYFAGRSALSAMVCAAILISIVLQWFGLSASRVAGNDGASVPRQVSEGQKLGGLRWVKLRQPIKEDETAIVAAALTINQIRLTAEERHGQ